MQFSKIVALAALAIGASAYSNDTVYTTEVLTEYTTVCPAATTLTFNGQTITATQSETITLPCPCTVSKPIYTSTTVICNTCSAAQTSVPVVYANSTSPAVVPTTTAAASTTAAVGTTSRTTSLTTNPANTSPATTASAPTTAFTGAANKFAASGASLAGLVGLVAYML